MSAPGAAVRAESKQRHAVAFLRIDEGELQFILVHGEYAKRSTRTIWPIRSSGEPASIRLKKANNSS